MQSILITGSAGFIGSNLVKRLFSEMSEGTIVGLDNLNDHCDVSLKTGLRSLKRSTINSRQP